MLAARLEKGRQKAGNGAQDSVQDALDIHEKAGNNGVKNPDERAEDDEQRLQHNQKAVH